MAGEFRSCFPSMHGIVLRTLFEIYHISTNVELFTFLKQERAEED